MPGHAIISIKPIFSRERLYESSLQDIHSDYRRYRATGEKDWLQVVFLSQGFWASFVYRLSRMVYVKVRIPVIHQMLRLISQVAH